ncbi:UNKNOWN [Stylonychia lemnae]|uniref:Uncharacterized protein n=1 Tax=Stylonychia lemnae TaxID=5949 RepID=A0A077ZQN0_STYLE|nr:UNKNOWN [Stylonychia lemnae]|eukprot:CDW71690.1 UNKNOWN [Stylonychia lemnae]
MRLFKIKALIQQQKKRTSQLFNQFEKKAKELESSNKPMKKKKEDAKNLIFKLIEDFQSENMRFIEGLNLSGQKNQVPFDKLKLIFG